MYAWMYCDLEYNGVTPEKCLPYDRCVLFDDNVEWFGDKLIDAAFDLEDGFDLAMVYFNRIDHMGHTYGPKSKEMAEAIMDIDEKLGNLLDFLEAFDLRSETNIIIVSDHGMAPNIPTISQKLTDYVDPELIDKAVDPAIYTMISLKDPSTADQVVASFDAWDGVNAYKKEDIPEHLHFKESEYALDVLAVADLGHKISDSHEYASLFVPPAFERDGYEDGETSITI